MISSWPNRIKLLYAKFTAEAKEAEPVIGELATIVMRALVEDISTTNYCKGNLASLLVARKALESLKGPVMFQHIKTLEFADDIDLDMFDRSVMSIKNCAKVIIPNSHTRFQVLTKCALVAEVKTKN